MSLNKIGIVKMLNDHIGIPKNESAGIIESFFDIIKDQLNQGNDVRISGFGKWTVKSKNKRIGRNPQTGKEFTIKARRVVTFKPSIILRDHINTGK